MLKPLLVLPIFSHLLHCLQFQLFDTLPAQQYLRLIMHFNSVLCHQCQQYPHLPGMQLSMRKLSQCNLLFDMRGRVHAFGWTLQHDMLSWFLF